MSARTLLGFVGLFLIAFGIALRFAVDRIVDETFRRAYDLGKKHGIESGRFAERYGREPV